jgi:pimeloyl-ACP methyl ester carboxylesterase
MKWLWRSLFVAVILTGILSITFYFRPVSYFNAWLYAHEYRAGIENRWVSVEGYRVHYLVGGPANGPAVLLVHGLGARADDWSNLAPYLIHSGFRVYMPDLIGYGRSQQPANFSYSVRDEAGIVVAFMDALGLKRVDLGGWSMGGWIAQLVALQHPERVGKLIIFDSAGLNIKPSWNTGLFTPQNPAQLDQLEALLMPHPQPIPPFVARDLVRRSRHNAWVIHRAVNSMLTAQDVTDKLLPQLKMPVLLVWGSLDEVIPIDQAETIHRLIPQSKLDVINGCGHLAPLQCAPQIGPALVQFAEN